ncbi:hypothetical protein C5167_048275 [Papaver somniferum]|uniref:Uncharacterized protein n=1 Tax=Papaver somniferum TaxID=3469 RepID=A0A4Y7KHG7_PAPSO|nr:hypothetical protein C5167_048275 [Papaver somniferum]
MQLPQLLIQTSTVNQNQKNKILLHQILIVLQMLLLGVLFGINYAWRYQLQSPWLHYLYSFYPIFSGQFFEVLIGARQPLWKLLSRIAVVYIMEPIFTICFVINTTT